MHLLFTTISHALYVPRRYVVSEGEKQATFTGAQQREGVYALPFIVDGLFGVGRRKAARGDGVNELEVAEQAAAAHVASAEGGGRLFPLLAVDGEGTARRPARRQQAAKADSDASDEDDDAKLAPGFEFDWVAYREAFGDKPVEDAVTSMFAEYASLYAALCGQVGSAAAQPLTLSQAATLDAKASNFINNFATPLLGVMNTTKVHRLLRHVMDAIRWHGNLANGSTASNESQHKDDKPYYVRTNRGFDTFTAQIVRHSQGGRIILADHKRAEGERSARCDPVPGNADRGAGACGADGYDSDRELDAMLGDSLYAGEEDEEGGVGETEGDGGRKHGRIDRQSVAELSWRPGLVNCGKVLGMRAQDAVGVLSCRRFKARLGGGAELSQLLRASPSFYRAPWYDSVAFGRPGGSRDSRTAAAAADSGDAATATSGYGEVRALVRRDDGDYALVVMMEEVAAVPGCAFSARKCQRLRWAIPTDGSDWDVRLVPIEDIQRLVHVVPDFGHLLRTVGREVPPPPNTAPVAVLRGARYIVNDFFPWG